MARKTPSTSGTLKGVGRIYHPTFIDTYTKVGFAKLYTEKTPLTAADLLNDRVLTFFDQDFVFSAALSLLLSIEFTAVEPVIARNISG